MRPLHWNLLIAAALTLNARAAQAAEADPLATAPAELRAAVEQLLRVVPDWKLHQIDRDPTVVVADQKGYRVVLRRSWMDYPDGHQMPQAASADTGAGRTVPKHEDWHFVLLPLAAVYLPADAKRDILWHIADEKTYRLPVAMGEGHGFVWYSYASIPMQYHIREQLKLAGGDDQLQLLVRGLSIDDEGTNTRNSVIPFFVKFGDPGFDALVRVFQDKSNGLGPRLEDALCAIRAMTYFRDERATRRLVEIYFTAWNDQIKRTAAQSLLYAPIRNEAKNAYLDMIRRRIGIPSVLQVCEQAAWKDALPEIQKVVEQPGSITAHLTAYPVYRSLAGKPIDPSLESAAETIRRQIWHDETKRPGEQELAAARRQLIESNDPEAVAYIAFTLARFVTKGPTEPIRKDGDDILRKLPRGPVATMFNRLMNGLEDKYEQDETQKLRQRVGA